MPQLRQKESLSEKYKKFEPKALPSIPLWLAIVMLVSALGVGWFLGGRW